MTPPGKMDQKQLDFIAYRHRLWLEGDKGGKMADLSFIDFSGSDLDFKGINFKFARLRSTCLRGVDLSDSNLADTDMTGADLSNANLSGAKFDYARIFEVNLSGANIQDVSLRGVHGNDREILTILTWEHHIVITDHEVWINDRHRSWNEWLQADDDCFCTHIPLGQNDIGLDWWRHWKPRLSVIINERKSSPDNAPEAVMMP